MSYFALDRDLLTSSLWAEAAPPAFKVWIYMLLVAKADGAVEDTLPALALHCGISKDDARDAVEFLSRPDPESRSKALDGRRIEAVETGGYRIVNYAERMKKDHSTPRVRRFRAHRQGLDNETPCNAPAFHETNEEGNRKPKQETTDNVNRLVAPDGAQRVFDHWREVMGHQTASLTPKRLRLIQARLKDGYTVERLCAAVDGCKLSPFHQGENDRHTRYDDLALICRDGEHVEQLEALARDGLTAGPQRKTLAEHNRAEIQKAIDSGLVQMATGQSRTALQ